MLTEMSGLARVLDCGDDLLALVLLAWVIGAAFGALGYHFLKNWDG